MRLDRHVGTVAVLVKTINVIGLQTLQRSPGRATDLLRLDFGGVEEGHPVVHPSPR